MINVTSEYIVFADIPNEAIVRRFSLGELISLTDSSQACSALLSLELFTAGRSTASIASDLRDRNLVLDQSVAHAMGLVARTFGLDGNHVSAEMIAAFVGRLVDGWFINSSPASNAEYSIACNFSNALRSRRHNEEDVMAACESCPTDTVVEHKLIITLSFLLVLDGLNEGFRSIARFSKRRS